MRVTWPALAFILAACGGDPTPAVEDEFEVVPEGKEDSYRSPSAMEFAARADSQVQLDAADANLGDAERLAKANDLVSGKLLEIGWFLNLWVSDKEPEDVNKDYGGFHAQARNASVKALKVDAAGTDKVSFKFNFEAQIAAQNDFLRIVPGKAQPDGSKLVELKMIKATNAQLIEGAWKSYDVHSWDPAKEDPSRIETLQVTVKAIDRSSNAYLDYNRLWADGKLVVGAQFGWDYNEGREDLRNAREFYDDLLSIGFKSPVAKYEDLKLDSPPLTRAATVHGQSVSVEVKLVHPGMVASPSANAVDLRNALLDMLATREVILFNGHAGVSGRLLPADFRSTSAGNIMPDEYPKLKLYDGFQIFLIEGCQTYARFTDGFRQNPLKRGPNGELVNMDIVTSTSYTWTSQGAEMMEAILFPLVGRSASTNVKPATWDDVLREMNAYPNDTAFMGVNGIDNDPHAHPYAQLATLGQTCTSSATCGGEGNACVKPNQAAKAKVCATVCLDDAGCPGDYKCARIATGGAISGNACVKR